MDTANFPWSDTGGGARRLMMSTNMNETNRHTNA